MNGLWKEVLLGDIGSVYAGLIGKAKDDFGAGMPYGTVAKLVE